MPQSFDIQPNKKKPAPAPARAAPSSFVPVDMGRRTPSSLHTQKPAPSRVAMPTRKEAGRHERPTKTVTRLRTRRRLKKNKLIFIALAVLAFVSGIAVVVLWQPFLRIQNVTATGPQSDTLPMFVMSTLQGRRYGIFPRSSIFFIPTNDVRTAILETYPNIEAVSLSPSGLTTLSVNALGRARAFVWCGMTYTGEHTACFETDPEGKIFKQIQQVTSSIASTTASSTAPTPPLTTTDFVVYGHYQARDAQNDSPLGATLDGATYLPQMLRFVKTLKSLGANITSVEIRGDEADLYTTYGTRITYVLGREQQAASLAATAFPSLTLSNSSLLYVDLRFDSKVFFKKRDSAPAGKK